MARTTTVDLKELRDGVVSRAACEKRSVSDVVRDAVRYYLGVQPTDGQAVLAGDSSADSWTPPRELGRPSRRPRAAAGETSGQTPTAVVQDEVAAIPAGSPLAGLIAKETSPAPSLTINVIEERARAIAAVLRALVAGPKEVDSIAEFTGLDPRIADQAVEDLTADGRVELRCLPDGLMVLKLVSSPIYTISSTFLADGYTVERDGERIDDTVYATSAEAEQAVEQLLASIA